MNFVIFIPRKGHVIMQIKLPKQQEIDALITDAGLEILNYDAGFRYYRVRINPTLDDAQRQTLSTLVRQARASFG